ncbi:hypothetical protein MW7_007260 [Imbroritus primus]|uniref:Uncharacterized protein n=1 Tax=Imbroritus primus TaxID=3058603 RepID=A0ACD3SQJ3_9BURK|nr:hypothetical protein MW7_007260 [Burkholderiaceae bacterium PBA]
MARGGQLARLAGMWCNDPEFWAFLNKRASTPGAVADAGRAADQVRYMCAVQSRAELDNDAQAAALFHRRVRLPFMAWKRGARS